MDKDGLHGALKRLDWSQADLSRRLGVHVNTVSGWATGKLAVPDYVEEYLRVCVLAKEVLEP